MTSSLTAVLSELKEKARATLDFDPNNCNGAEQNARAAFVRACSPAFIMALVELAEEVNKYRKLFPDECDLMEKLRRLETVIEEMGK